MNRTELEKKVGIGSFKKIANTEAYEVLDILKSRGWKPASIEVVGDSSAKTVAVINRVNGDSILSIVTHGEGYNWMPEVLTFFSTEGIFIFRLGSLRE